MPIRMTLAATLSLGAAVAGGGLLDRARAADLVDDTFVAEVEGRDLAPAPEKPWTKPWEEGRRPHVTLRPSSPVVAVGTPISFEGGSSVRGYGHLYVLSASGRAQVWMENMPITARRRLVFPSGRLDIRAVAPAGREDIVLVVTRKRIEGIFGYRSTRRPRTVDYGHKRFKQLLSEIFLELPRRQWGYARTSVRVVRRTSDSGWDWDRAEAGSDLWDGAWDRDDGDDRDDRD